MPSADPSAVPRRIGATIRFRSSRLGMRPVILDSATVRVRSVSRLEMISPRPNTPIATTTKLMPSESSGTSNE